MQKCMKDLSITEVARFELQFIILGKSRHIFLYVLNDYVLYVLDMFDCNFLDEYHCNF